MSLLQPQSTFRAFFVCLLLLLKSFQLLKYCYNLTGIYLFNINNGNIRIMCEISSKLIIKTPEEPQRRRSLSSLFTLNKFQTLF